MSSIGFTGTELLKNIKKRTYTSKAELVRECGYQEVDYYGVEKINYSKLRLKIFLTGLLIIIFSELSLRFVDNSIYNNLIIILIPVILCLFLYYYFLYKFKMRKVL